MQSTAAGREHAPSHARFIAPARGLASFLVPHRRLTDCHPTRPRTPWPAGRPNWWRRKRADVVTE